MKSIIPIVLVALIASCSQNKSEPAVDYTSLDTELQTLLKEGEYFRLRSTLRKKGNILPAEKKKFYQAFIESAFNHPASSSLLADSLLKISNPSLNDSAQVDLMLLLRDNYFKSYQYKRAAETGQTILRNHKNILGDRLHDVENTLLIHEGLKDIPPQLVSIKTVNLKWTPNKIGLIEIPVKTKGATFGIVFDTRAHISTVTERFAKKLGLKILDASFEESSGITGIKFKSRLGVADSLFLGDILIQNAIFQVLPDEQLHFASLNFTLDGILGFQVLTQLKEVHIFQNGDFIISQPGTTSRLNNLAFDGSTTVISVVNDNDTLAFHFDTGATGTEFYGNYFNKFKDKTISNGTLQTVETGGVGGSMKMEVYILPIVNLKIGENKIELKDIAVRTTPAFKGQKYNGNVGQDVIKQFAEMILDFESMCLEFK